MPVAGTKNAPAAPNYGPQAMARAHVLNTQKFLAAKGYHIAIDGKMGPQTRAAIADWHTGVNHRPLLKAHNAATKTVLAGKSPAPKGSKGGNAGAGPSVGGGGSAKGGGAPKAPAASPYQLINPASYAKAAVDTAYGPVIQDLLSQRSQAQAQGQQNQADISGWIQQLMGTQQEGAQANAAALAKAVQDNQQQTAGIENLFGGTGGHDLANVAANNLANINAIGQSTGSFDRHMAAILQAQGVDQHLAAQRATDSALADIATKLGAQRSAKASAYTKALQDAYGTRLQQQAAIQNIQLAGQMAPVQLAQAKANLAATQSRTKIAQIQAEQAGKQAALQNKVVQAQLAQFRATQGGKAVPFNQLQAGDRLKLTAAITKGIRSNLKLGGKHGVGGGMSQTAEGNHKVWGAIKAMLSPYDTTDPQVRQFALGILRQLSGHFTASNFK